MFYQIILSSILLFALLGGAHSAAFPLWSKNTPYPIEGRSNPYELPGDQVPEMIRAGKLHALHYPVEATGILLPYEPIRQLSDSKDKGLFRKLLNYFMERVFKAESFDGIQDWLGLHKYPKVETQGVYGVPFKNGTRPENRMGFTLMERFGAKGFTYSCAACHSGTLFGRPVIGMTNRFPNANEYFLKGKKGMKVLGPNRFRILTRANSAETKMFAQARKHVGAVGAKRPEVLGLDTSASHIIRSLARRNSDDILSRNRSFERRPKVDVIGDWITDSKPAPWWNVKYKNRWFLDGALVSGNPIITAIIWNEIGRGVDLEKLEDWISTNPGIIAELTQAVLSSEAPRITDFFEPRRIDLHSAKRGEKIFNSRCAKCHGNYLKVWSQPGSEELDYADQLKTFKVEYHEQTPVRDVGTDPTRSMAILPIEKLNDLRIMKKFGIQLELQKGYVPPPLVGIWARWPYFHNNSIPSLCALMMPEDARPKIYYAGQATDPNQDFDFECNGYPTQEKAPAAWKTSTRSTYRVKEKGLSNKGHSQGIFVKNGIELLSASDKKDLIQFLQTL